MKRFTETAKWDDPWFRGLSPSEKLVFFFVVDNCDNAGFYEADSAAMAFKTRLTQQEIEGALKGLERGIKGASGWLWVRRFLKHQRNGDLDPVNPAHRQIIRLLAEQRVRFSGCAEFKEFLAPFKGLLSPIGIGTSKGKGDTKGEKPAMARPSLDDAIAYGSEIGMARQQVESWFDHFQSNGWKVGGRAPMKDWKAALRNGQRNAFSGKGAAEKPKQKLRMV